MVFSLYKCQLHVAEKEWKHRTKSMNYKWSSRKPIWTQCERRTSGSQFTALLTGTFFFLLFLVFFFVIKKKAVRVLQNEMTHLIKVCYMLNNKPALVLLRVILFWKRSPRLALVLLSHHQSDLTQVHSWSLKNADQSTGYSHWHSTPVYKTDMIFAPPAYKMDMIFLPKRTIGFLQHWCETHQTNRIRKYRGSLAHFSKTDMLTSYSPKLLLCLVLLLTLWVTKIQRWLKHFFLKLSTISSIS